MRLYPLWLWTAQAIFVPCWRKNALRVEEYSVGGRIFWWWKNALWVAGCHDDERILPPTGHFSITRIFFHPRGILSSLEQSFINGAFFHPQGIFPPIRHENILCSSLVRVGKDSHFVCCHYTWSGKILLGKNLVWKGSVRTSKGGCPGIKKGVSGDPFPRRKLYQIRLIGRKNGWKNPCRWKNALWMEGCFTGGIRCQIPWFSRFDELPLILLGFPFEIFKFHNTSSKKMSNDLCQTISSNVYYGFCPCLSRALRICCLQDVCLNIHISDGEFAKPPSG